MNTSKHYKSLSSFNNEYLYISEIKYPNKNMHNKNRRIRKCNHNNTIKLHKHAIETLTIHYDIINKVLQ